MEFKVKISSDFKYVAVALLALIAVPGIYYWQGTSSIYLLIAIILWLYMAVNIGSNDVANNMGPAVWSKALTIGWAIVIAAIFEAAWVMIAWGDVVNTVKKGIIDPTLIKDSMQFIAIMMATLMWAALWVNIATILRAPVSTTHAVIGGLVWAWITSSGLWLAVSDWGLLLKLFWIIILFPLVIWLLSKYLSERSEWIFDNLFRKKIRKKLHKDVQRGQVLFYVLFWIFLVYMLVNGFSSVWLLIHNHSIVDWVQIWKIAASWVISPVMGWFIAVLLLLSIRKNILKKEDRGEAAKVWVPVYIALMVWAFGTYLILKGFKQVLKGSNFEVLLNPEVAVLVGYILWIIVFITLRLLFSRKESVFKNGKKFINNLFNIPLIFAVALLSFAHWANDVANAIGPLAAINDAIKNHWISGGNVSIEIWVMILWAFGLVFGLSIFGARLIKTVWNEITKLNQIRAYCVALSAAITVILASQLGLPVSSTHIALGWVFGIGLTREYMKRQQWKDKDYVAKDMIKTIAAAWVITLPAAGLISWVTYLVIMNLI